MAHPKRGGGRASAMRRDHQIISRLSQEHLKPTPLCLNFQASRLAALVALAAILLEGARS
jgi:hypothetical protein